MGLLLWQDPDAGVEIKEETFDTSTRIVIFVFRTTIVLFVFPIIYKQLTYFLILFGKS